jgi:hypothetical protein
VNDFRQYYTIVMVGTPANEEEWVAGVTGTHNYLYGYVLRAFDTDLPEDEAISRIRAGLEAHGWTCWYDSDYVWHGELQSHIYWFYKKEDKYASLRIDFVQGANTRPRYSIEFSYRSGENSVTQPIPRCLTARVHHPSFSFAQRDISYKEEV